MFLVQAMYVPHKCYVTATWSISDAHLYSYMNFTFIYTAYQGVFATYVRYYFGV